MAWAISDCGTILWQFGTFHTEEDAKNRIEALSYFGDMLEPVELDENDDINTEYMNDR
jgi:hypothetical protein